MDKLPRCSRVFRGLMWLLPASSPFWARGHIIVTPLDITNALLDCRALGISGRYSAGYAMPFVKNMLLWAYNGQPEQ